MVVVWVVVCRLVTVSEQARKGRKPMSDSGFGQWLDEHGDEAIWVADLVKVRQATLGVPTNGKRILQPAKRTAGKVARHRTNGNGLNVARHRSTVSDYTRRVSRSAESQYMSRDDARRIRLAVQGVFV